VPPVIQPWSSEGVSVTVVAPTSEAVQTITPDPALTQQPDDRTPIELGSPGFGGWLLMLIILAACSILAFFIGDRIATQTWGWRWGMCTTGGGLLGYLYLALRLPGAGEFIQLSGYGGISAAVAAGALIGWGAGALWYKIANK
jgi:hypothetical protein